MDDLKPLDFVPDVECEFRGHAAGLGTHVPSQRASVYVRVMHPIGQCRRFKLGLYTPQIVACCRGYGDFIKAHENTAVACTSCGTTYRLGDVMVLIGKIHEENNHA